MPKFNRNRFRSILVVAIFTLALSSYLNSANPAAWQASVVHAAPGIYQSLNFQGRLLNDDGTVVTNGTYSVVFSLYTVDSGGTNIWTETQSVTTYSGLFRASLGSVSTLSGVNFNQDALYLGIKVESDLEMTPRMRLTAAPYAFEAKRVGGLTVTNNGGNTLDIGANKTVTFGNSLGFTGTDSTSFVLPGANTTLVGTDSTQTLSNKTLSGLTISGFTNNGGILYTDGSGVVAQTLVGDSGDCLKSSGGGSPTWGSCASAGSLLTDGGTFTFLTSTTEDFVLGGNSIASGALHMDVSTGYLNLGTDGSINGGLKFYSSATGVSASIFTDASGNLNLLPDSGGAVVVGGGSGDIELVLTGENDLFLASKSVAALSGVYSQSDFEFTRDITGGSNNLSGAVVKIYDTSSSSGTITNDMLLINAAPASGTYSGNLINAQVGGSSKLTLSASGILALTGGILGTMTTLDGSTTTNGTGTASTSMILTSATNFTVGNYIKLDSTNCTTGVNTCYAKVTNISTNTLTISPALTWSSGATVTEMYIPEVGGSNTASALNTRYGRGYFIDGIVAGNGTTYFTDRGITNTSGAAIEINGLQIGATTGTLTIANGKTLTINSSITFSGTDGTTFTLPGANATLVGTDSTQTLSNKTISGLTLSDTTTLTGFTNNGGILYTNGSGVLAQTTVGDSGQCLQSIGGGVPTWGSCGGSVAADSLDFDDFSDTMALDVSTDIALGSGLTLSTSGIGGLSFGHSGSTTFSNTVTIGSGGNTVSLSSTGILLAGNARPVKIITISPEYAGATIYADGASSTDGTLTASNTGSGSGWRNYYEWSSTQATLQEYTIMARVTLPQDFSAWDTNALSVAYQTGTASTADNAISARINNETDTPGTVVCDLSTDRASTSWTTSNMVCSDTQMVSGSAPEWDAAGEIAVVRIKVKAKNTASALTRVGDITLRYLARY